MALSEIATNQKVEGGGEYNIISSSFGLNIGGTIGLSLYLSQAISVAFFVIAFTEAFEPFFNFIYSKTGIMLHRQAISMPAMAILALVILRRGANMDVKALYIVAALLSLSLVLFFAGKTEYSSTGLVSNFVFKNPQDFFIVFAIVYGLYRNDRRCGIIRRFEKSRKIHSSRYSYGNTYWYDHLYPCCVETIRISKPR